MVQALRLSESEIAQKSPPSGAPTSAAAASIAVTPGSTLMSRSRHAGSPDSTASNTAAAMANTPGSPPDTTATWRPDSGKRQREPRAIEFDAIVRSVAALVVARGNAVEIGTVAHEVGGARQRGLRRRRHQLGLAGPRADHHERAVHSRLPSPGISTMAK